jgi:hypothetical protein
VNLSQIPEQKMKRSHEVIKTSCVREPLLDDLRKLTIAGASPLVIGISDTKEFSGKLSCLKGTLTRIIDRHK